MQNHVDNHKSSMASQTVITELLRGDEVRLYMYTNTGLLDKSGNHLTQFAGMLMRPGEEGGKKCTPESFPHHPFCSFGVQGLPRWEQIISDELRMHHWVNKYQR